MKNPMYLDMTLIELARIYLIKFKRIDSPTVGQVLHIAKKIRDFAEHKSKNKAEPSIEFKTGITIYNENIILPRHRKMREKAFV